ncbi:MAG: CoA-binding protein [Cytophagales bacterium]|nr:CoA-binding protein [Cytophagales bacterium]
MKKTVVIGASPESSRYSNLAGRMLDNAGFEFVPVGIREGKILGKRILNLKEKPAVEDVHTVTIYLSPSNQKEWYCYILDLKPKRIIFNPGTENPELAKLANLRGIETENACNLVLIQTGQF